MPETSHPTPGFLLRLVKGLVPIAVMLAIVYAPGARTEAPSNISLSSFFLRTCFGLGWRWLKATLLAKWIGFCISWPPG